MVNNASSPFVEQAHRSADNPLLRHSLDRSNSFRPSRLSSQVIYESDGELSPEDSDSSWSDMSSLSVAFTNGSFEDSIPHTMEKDLPDGGNWVVQKFGGTSLGKFAVDICDIVKDNLKYNRIAVVCSARSNHTKSEGTTSRLLRAAKEAKEAHSKAFLPIVHAIEEDHVQAAKKTISSPEILAQYIEEVSNECQSLIKILESAQHLEEVSPGAENKIISRGEILACKYMAALLNDRGVATQFVDFSDIIRSYNISKAKSSLDPRFYQQLATAFAKEIATEIATCRDKVPIVTGYFGNVQNGLLNSIGRGYTDLCAALVAVGVGAKELQIWKEVDGIFTADPRKVPTACLIPSVTPSEAAELTFYGSEVIHPFTMEQVIRAKIPIRIKNVMNPQGSGTIIRPDPEDNSSDDPTRPPKLFRTRSSSALELLHKPKRPTAVTIKHSIIVLNIHSNKRTRAQGFLTKIFSILDTWDLSVDLIASSEVHVSMALHSERPMVSMGKDEELRIQDHKLHGAVTDLAELGHVDISSDMAIVSLVGKELKNLTGISGRFFSVLGENNINIEMISQGASEINISCVIWARDADRALNVLHTNLFTFL